eukprot:COSAG02_NODE_3978_length_5960_cov_5.861116_4_plen_88_part_00
MQFVCMYGTSTYSGYRHSAVHCNASVHLHGSPAARRAGSPRLVCKSGLPYSTALLPFHSRNSLAFGIHSGALILAKVFVGLYSTNYE